MSSLTKYSLIVIGIFISIVFIFYVVAHLSFTGAFDKKYTREELTQNFIDHEREFLDIITFFKEIVPEKKDYSISFWQYGKKVSLYLRTYDQKIIGATDVRVESHKLDSALLKLGWSKETLTLLRDKLKKTNCNFISIDDTNNNIFSLSPHQSGWGSFTYRVWDKPILDSLIHVHGAPLGIDSFSIRVVLNYSSAL